MSDLARMLYLDGLGRERRTQAQTDELQRLILEQDERYRHLSAYHDEALCIFCTENPVSPAHDPYCSAQCAIQAESESGYGWGV